ncbi:syntaxin-7-like, partial [Sinocyclocheilus grahami]|uniref:syntaxin-7-like n=1 Tax=Sinocyclocheilus grahami TaxID=75366 RepID=UPI0007AD041F
HKPVAQEVFSSVCLSRYCLPFLPANEIQQMMRHFGTAQDTTDLRQTLQEKQQKVNQLAKATDKCMKDYSALPVTTEQRQRKIQRERLITEFSNALALFQKAQREVAKKEKEFVARVRASTRISGGDLDDGFGGFPSPFQSYIFVPMAECRIPKAD